MPGYNDITPRMGAAYDLLGNGKTSLKVNLGKCLQPANNQDRYTLMNPAGGTRFQRTTNRTWNDRGGLGKRRLRPAVRFHEPERQRRVRPMAARVRPAAFSCADQPGDPRRLGRAAIRLAVRRVGSARSASRPSVEVGYYRRWFQGFLVTDNLCVDTG